MCAVHSTLAQSNISSIFVFIAWEHFDYSTVAGQPLAKKKSIPIYKALARIPLQCCAYRFAVFSTQ